MLTMREIRWYQPVGLLRVAEILYACGRDMASRYGLQHWNNPRFKTWAIVALCVLKNRIFLGADAQGKAVATVQVKVLGNALHLAKLAVLPAAGGKGCGSRCLEWAEEYARVQGCDSVELEVYDRSSHALAFYHNRGYERCGSMETRKYTEIRMKKML